MQNEKNTIRTAYDSTIHERLEEKAIYFDVDDRFKEEFLQDYENPEAEKTNNLTSSVPLAVQGYDFLCRLGMLEDPRYAGAADLLLTTAKRCKKYLPHEHEGLEEVRAILPIFETAYHRLITEPLQNGGGVP